MRILHLAVSQNIINNYRNKENDTEMLEIMQECEPLVYKMYDEAVQQEKDWADYLFKEGSMIGLNATLLNQYVEFMANRRMKSIGLTPPYEQSVQKQSSTLDRTLVEQSWLTKCTTRNRDRKLCGRWHQTRCRNKQF